MHDFKKMALAAAVSSTIALTGCGGSGGSGDAGDGGGSGGETISGTASAPGGQVAHFETQNLFEVALSFVISPVAAAITGLEPIQGANVDLIRVDDEGNQIGDVLATTETSITGDYKLTLPQGVNLAGNLIVRITGANHDLRAQVVEKEVDISPTSEFVLRKFIQTGADLDQLEVTDIVKLSGRVEEFDMTAGANLDQMFDVLEQEVGDFLENEVAVVAGGEGDAASVAGNYRSVAVGLELYDDDDSGWGTYAHVLWASTFQFADGGDNTVSISLVDEDDLYGSLGGVSLSDYWINHETGFEEVNESFDGTLTQSGILSIQGEFEEELGEEEGSRWPSITYNLVQAGDKGLFFVQPNEASVRYALTDTDNDGNPDALDPTRKLGDDISRSLEVFARQPENFQDSGLNGDFGRVYVRSEFVSGTAYLETEVNTLTFHGDGTFDYAEVTANHGHDISLSSSGPAYSPVTDTADTGVEIVITASGDITTIGGESADGFINDTADFIVMSGGEGTAGSQSMIDMTLMTKLPTSAPSVTDKKFRMQQLSMKLASDERFLLTSGKFNTFLSMTSETQGIINASFLEVEKTGLNGQVSVSTDLVDGAEVSTSVAANGATTITIESTGGATTLDGFFNEDASLGLFALRWAPTDGVPDELGLVVLTATD